MGILAGRPVHLEWEFTTATPPTPDPTAAVTVTTTAGTVVEALTPTVVVDDVTVTITAEWLIPDGQPGGRYVATVDVDGSLIEADQVVITVDRRTYVETAP